MPILHVESGEVQQETPLLAAALDYIQRGWRVVPLHTVVGGKCTCERPNCGQLGKHPLTRHGLKEGTIDEATVRRWWSEAPTANVGIITGPESGLFMLGPDGQEGVKAVAALERQNTPLPLTPRARSGSGSGRHYLFHWPAAGTVKTMANVNGLAIDTRGNGGLFVAPPSLHKSGNRYTWEVHPDALPLAEAPAWLLTWLHDARGTIKPHKKKSQRKKPKPTQADGGKQLLTVTAGNRLDAVQRATAYLAKCDPAVSGQGGHSQTFEVARAIVWGFDLGADVGFDLLWQNYNPRCQPPWSEAELRHKCADADTKPLVKPRGYLLWEGEDGQQGAAGPGRAESPGGVDEDIEALPMPPPAPWPELPDAALYGLAGEIVATLAPETESAPVAILGQLLVAYGSAAGRGPHFLVEGDAHHTNLFQCLVGDSSRGRKGTSRGRVMQLMEHADSDWRTRCIAGGLSTGAGLIFHVRDQLVKKEPVKKQGRVVGYQEVVVDEGVADKRLLVDESEFAQVLRVMEREGNNLSPVVRQAWDTGNLRNLTKNDPNRATGAHVSISAHITRPELKALLKHTDALNGFANRFLWLAVRRARLLPDGGRALEVSPLGVRLRHALAAARHVGCMQRTEEAKRLWHEFYPKLTAERPGLYGAVTGRAEAQVLRLSMVFALLDGRADIDVPHLHAALALWSYADASARLIFGTEAEDPLPGLVLAKLREAPGGLTRTELRDAFHRNLSGGHLLAALAVLRDRGDARGEKVDHTGGRPAERWHAVRPNDKTTEAPDAGADAPLRSLCRSVVSPSPVNEAGAAAGEVVEL
jgi:hypothetical protein